MDIAISIDGVPIRLTMERWFHIVENHDDLAGYFDQVLTVISDPDFVMPGHGGSLIAAKSYGRKQYLMVIYRQISSDDGFIITAYFTDRVDRSKAIWKS